MKAEAAKLLVAHDWWAESLSVMHDSKSKQVLGSTRIFLGSYSTDSGGWVEVTQDEDYLLACNDARVIVKQLAAWSQLHKVKWQLEIAGDRIGDVANGQASKPVQDFVVGLCKASKLQEAAIPGLLKKFESRKEPEPPLPQPKKRAWWKFWGNSEA